MSHRPIDGVRPIRPQPQPEYESWCTSCQKVSTHIEGTCQEHPVGFPRVVMVNMVPKGRAA